MAITLHMSEASQAFNALAETRLDSFVKNGHLGLMGAESIELWTSRTGGILEFISANGGCTLNIYPSSMFLQDAVQPLFQELDGCQEQLVPIDRNGAITNYINDDVSVLKDKYPEISWDNILKPQF